MSPVAQAHPEEAKAQRKKSPGDGRRRQRLKVSLPVQVQPFDARFADIVDVGEVTDFTRHGLYFATCMPHYFLGMRLMLKFPYGDRIEAHKKFLGTIVRLEDRPDGNRGVAVQFVI
ncbi:MAG: PilZ domain-containing protein [Candidatus Acidiferrales bacterium]